ncbi:pentapeptide repeat-containing protein [Streptomyces sp. NPDC059744]|uniref:pentapeptide repeat-containing protein n=1 Tax=Streptomyces sp. NPDC059744 TaxID=3346929 RepID=UPI0036580E58
MSGDGSGRAVLRADCANCFGLCCVALTLTRSADFAVNKDAGQPCHNLKDDFRCGIHTELRTQGFPGCTVYDCFGAGQKVSQETFDGQDWRQAPQTAQQMFQVFPVMRQLHELLWYLTEALTLRAARPLHGEIRRALETTERLTHVAPDAFADLDVAGHRDDVAALLLRTSELVRATVPRKKKRNHRGADLIAADLTGADLRLADLIGADFRDAELSGADLTGSLFLTQAQLSAARGDAGTKLPPSLSPPSHWNK